MYVRDREKDVYMRNSGRLDHATDQRPLDSTPSDSPIPHSQADRKDYRRPLDKTPEPDNNRIQSQKNINV